MKRCARFATTVGSTFAALAATAQTPADVRDAGVREQFRSAYAAAQTDGSPEAVLSPALLAEVFNVKARLYRDPYNQQWALSVA